MKNKQIATVGGGCFWCIEAVMTRLNGVEKVVSGYSNGHKKDPNYREVSSGTTGHAEVTQITYDPEIISYEDLINVFMTSHDPTTLNQQGADRGTQYRSIIAYETEEEKAIAEKVIAQVQPSFSDPIVTEVVKLDKFYTAEQYHQDYYTKNSFAGYCRVVIDPKIKKLRDMWADKLKPEHVS